MAESEDSLLRVTGKFTMRSIKYLFLVSFSLGMINIAFFISSIFIFKPIDELYIYIWSLIAIFILGLLFTILGLYITYKFILIDALREVYKQLSPLLRKVCNLIIEKLGITPQSTALDSKLEKKPIDVMNILKTTYDNNVPKLFQKGIRFILKRVPFVAILEDIMNYRDYSSQDEINECFYEQVNLYIQDSIFTSNSMKWLYWYIPLNMIFQAVLIYFLHSL